MVRRTSSFLLRCRRSASGEQRVEIEWIQTGERVMTRSLAAAIGWLAMRSGNPSAGEADRPAQRHHAGDFPRQGGPMSDTHD
jgi:hypothetical protein